MTSRSPLPITQSTAESRANVLQGLLIAAIVIGGLYLAQEVLLPLAVAILLSFVLTPPMLVLQRIKVPRVLAVVVVVAVAFSILGGLGWLISHEATKLAGNLPSYRWTLSQKIDLVRETTAESQVLKKAGDVLAELESQLDKPAEVEGTKPGQVEVTEEDAEREPIPVEIRVPEPTGLDLYRSIAGKVLPPLMTAGIVLLFVVFILLEREDLRDRIIRLFGGSDLQRATSTMNEAAKRLSGYFLRQVLVNAAYGIFIGIALGAVGMPSPVAWGILAMMMRFVPYVGSYIAAAIPVLIAAAIDPGWSLVLIVIALFVVGEFTMGQIVEPLVYGRGTGVTPVAVIVSQVFWTWLWGPVGLIIATPITVCLAVLGRHVQGLSFFDVLLGDRPALSPAQGFYRHALIGDAANATYKAELALKDQSLLTYLDDVALGGLGIAERDLARGALEDEQTEQIAETVAEILENLDEYEPKRWFSRLRRHLEMVGAEPAKDDEPVDEPETEDAQVVDSKDFRPGWSVDTPVLCIAGRNGLDKAAALTLGRALEKRGLKASVLGPDTLSPGMIESLSETKAKLVCLSYLGFGGGPVEIRYMVRRLRRILPDGTMILVAYWNQENEGEAEAERKLLDVVNADGYANTLHEAVRFCEDAATKKPPSGSEESAQANAAPKTVPAA
ncbi:AI-2E family transporter [Methyloceanibacter caenitepidi]|uniref:AI-2E family transporter n=1 Tax=Methyloceanibacter caenitepidi TaxID=1384459 RepID=UPI0005F05D68|nr:AI-2E family transporter [Methyloceanibacter caenitepidi]